MSENTPNTAHEPATRSAALTGVFVGARIVSGLAAVGVMVAAVGGAALLPLPTIGGAARSALVEPAPVTQTRVCAGPLLRLGAADGTDATRANPLGTPDLRFAASTGTPERSTLESSDNTADDPPFRIDLGPGETTQPLLAASQSQGIATSGLGGFTASECVKPSADSWIVAGSTETGRTSLLTLANPSTVPSTVELELYTENGKVTATGLEGIVVPVGGQRILSLAGWVPDAASIVVHIRSAGGSVVAHVQHSVTRVLTPGGVDIAAPGAAPALTTVIPGFVVDAHQAIERLGLGGDLHDLASIVRLLAPGDSDATVTMTVRPTPGTAESVIEDGEQLTAETIAVPIELKAGVVTDLPFDHLLDGSYTITIESNVPVVASARSSAVGTASGGAASGIDFAWFTSASDLATESLVSVAPGPGAVLHLVNTTFTPALVQIEASTGASSAVEIPASDAAAVPLTAGGNFRVTGFESLYLSVSYAGAGQLAGFTVTGPLPIAAAVRVYH